MVVMIVEKAPARLRGELTKWMIEPKAGVYVGTMSAMVRDKLWDKAVAAMKDRGCIQIYRKNNEQGFTLRTSGKTRRKVVDVEGLLLISTFNP